MYRAALKASRHLLCSTSNALLLSTELLSRHSRSLLCSVCIALCVGTELLSRLPRHYPCSISYALLVSTELLSRFSRYLSISLHRSFVRTEQLSRLLRFMLCYPQREGFSKASVSWFKPFSRALQGFSKGPFLLFKNSCQRLCKGRLQRALLFIIHPIRHGTGNEQICTPHLLI